MSVRRVLVCVTAAVALGLAGCSGSDGDAGGDTGSAAAAPAAAADAGEAEGGGAVDTARAKALCAHLTEELPRIKAVGSEVGAMAQLTMSLAGYYEDHPQETDGTVLDAQTEQECPEVGAEMLKAAGMKSFSDL